MVTRKAVLLFALGAGGCLGGEAFEESSSGAIARPALAPGGIAARNGLSVRVPDPGFGVFSEALFEDGSVATVHIETHDDGTVVELVPGDGAPGDAGGAAAAAVEGPCFDRAYRLMGHVWDETFHFRFNRSSTPPGMYRDRAERAVRRAVSNVTRARNDCDLQDQVSATAAYDGRTARRANMDVEHGCLEMDGTNVVSFGTREDPVVAQACIWTSGGVALESDVELNTADYRFYVVRPSGCTARFSLEAVLTHEIGHTFGLGHVSEGQHGTQTMSTRILACSNDAATLGRGDVRGLRALY